MVKVSSECPGWMIDILFDPLTSGGLLFSFPSKQSEKLLTRMHKEGIKEAAIVGEVVPEPKGKIIVV